MQDKELEQLIKRCKQKNHPTQSDWKHYQSQGLDITPPHPISSLHEWVQAEEQRGAEWIRTERDTS